MPLIKSCLSRIPVSEGRCCWQRSQQIEVEVEGMGNWLQSIPFYCNPKEGLAAP